jgi:hypothetical protein
MFGFLKKKSAEVSVLLERIELAQQVVPDELKHLSAPLLESLSSTVNTKWEQEHIDNYVAQVRAGESHEAFIYNFLVHSVADKLESGHYHVYRGVLALEGMQYKALFEHVINTMVARGGYTQEWADENLRKVVYKGIKEIG